MWSFAVDGSDVEAIRPDVPARLVHRHHPAVDGRLLAVGDDSLVVSTPSTFAGGDGWELTADNAFVHRRLLERLDDLRSGGECDDDLLVELLHPDPYLPSEYDEPDGSGGASGADEQQELAARRAVEPGVRFTWGPPGTGKTRVLAMAVAQAAREGRRVLVLSHANVAVDVAMERIAEELDGDSIVDDGRVVRAGTPQSTSMASRHELLPHHIAGRHDPGSVERLERLAAELRELSASARLASGPDESVAAHVATAHEELRSLRAGLDAAAREVIDDALVIGTTLARSISDDQLWSSEFDVVIVDEASMAPLPIVLALVLRGAGSVSFFGDFRQLPPIAVSTDPAATAYFAKDVFEYGYVIEVHDNGMTDPRLTTLRTQFRMGESICAVVNELAYDGLLRTAPVARDAAIVGAERGIAPGEQLVVVDTSDLGVACSVEVDPERFSRCNPTHALLAASIAETLRADGFESVGVISPYRAQVELIRPLAAHLGGVSAATVHRFQGSECHAIVLDLTDAAPMTGPSQLTGRDRDLARRLLNVAVSRARQKLVVIADRRFVADVMPHGSLPAQLLDIVDDAAGVDLSGAVIASKLAALDQDAARSRAATRSPIWFSSWTGVISELESRVRTDGRFEINTANQEGLVTWVPTLAERLEHPSHSIVRARRADAEELEQLPFDLRLQERTSQPWVVLGHSVAVGSTATSSGDSHVALVDNPAFTSAWRRMIAPEER